MGKDSRIVGAVLGLGYVGLPLALEMVRQGCSVYGIDTDGERISQLLAGSSYVTDVPAEHVVGALQSQRFWPTTDATTLSEADTISICVPTPLRKTMDPDLSCVLSAVSTVGEHIRNGQLVILESTTYPGTTSEVVLPILENKGLRVGQEFFLAFSPERTDPGNKEYPPRRIPKIVGGVTPQCTTRAVEFYSRFFDRVIPVSSSQVAEMAKLVENTFRAVNIALVNEIMLMCDRMGIEVWEVIDAAATKPFGYMPFYPGPGIGGHCIPLDPAYLSWKARSHKFYNRFIELATDINANMPRYVAAKVSELLNAERKPLNGAQLLLLGVAYKKDVSDTRESPAEDVYVLLREHGALVDYHDPLVPKVSWQDETLQSVELTKNGLRRYDCVILLTDHSVFDYGFIAQHARLVLDTRNAYGSVKYPNIFRLGAMDFSKRRPMTRSSLADE